MSNCQLVETLPYNSLSDTLWKVRQKNESSLFTFSFTSPLILLNKSHRSLRILQLITWNLEGIQGMCIVWVGTAWADKVGKRLLVQNILSLMRYGNLFATLLAASVFGTEVFPWLVIHSNTYWPISPASFPSCLPYFFDPLVSSYHS